MADAGQRARRENGRQRRREDKSRSVAADAVDYRPVGGDIALNTPDSCGRLTLDDRHALGLSVTLLE